MNKKNTATISLIVLIGIVILINLFVDRFFFRLDFTEDQRYTLSNATENILESLEEPVTVTAYFSEELPPNIAKIRRDFKELLVEYSSVSGGNVLFEFVDPAKDEETEQKAMQAGIQPVYLDVRDKDQAMQKKAFLGAVIQSGEQEKEVIPYIQPGAAMEYALSSSIKKISVIDKPVIGFLQGHGEPSLQAFMQVMQQLMVLYDIRPVRLPDTSFTDLSEYKTIAIVAPKDSLNPNHLRQLDNYMESGGNLVVAINRVQGDLSTASGSTINTGLENWLMSMGITVENNFVTDAQCGQVTVQTNSPFNFVKSFPYLPVFTNFNEHPVTQGLEQVMMQFVSSITFNNDSSIEFTPLVYSSETAGTQPPPLYFDIEKDWTEADFPLSNLVVAATFTGKLTGKGNSKMVVIGDGDFPVNGEGQNARQIQADNASLLVNSIDWLTDETGLIDLRTKGVTARPIDQVEDSTKTLLKWLNFLLPVILFVVYGFLRMQRKRNSRVKRMEEGYI